jgi:ATP-binding cassette subfamily F protein uup
LSYNEQRELTELPGRIAALEEEQAALNARVQAPEFYKEASDAIAATLARVEQVGDELLAVYARWDELDSRT